MGIDDKLPISEVAPGGFLSRRERGVSSAIDVVAKLDALVESLPAMPWDGDCSPEDDKRILAVRYE